MRYNILTKPKKLLQLIIILAILLGAVSCIKDKFDFERMAQIEWEPTLAAPIIHTKLTLWDVLYDWDSSHIVVQDENKFLTLIYRGTIFSQTAQELIKIPDNNLPPFDTTFTKPNLVTEINIVFPMYFSAGNNERLDEIYLKQGNCELSFISNLKSSANVTFTFQDITRISDGAQLVVSYPNVPTGPSQLVNNVNFTGYKIKLKHPTPTSTVNYLDVSMKVVFSDPGLLTDNHIALNTRITNMLFSKLLGYFGQPSFVIREDSVFLDVFKRSLGGRFTVKEPELNIYVTNSYGFPINIIFDKFSSYRSVVPLDSVPITGSGFPNPWIINSPTISEIGQSKLSELKLNNSTCNIGDAINIAPQYIVYHTRASGNPAGYISQNFVLDTSKFKVDVDVKLPLWGKAINFTVQDTFKIEEFKTENRDKVDWIGIRVTATNGFPVDVNLQLIFTDTLYNRIDSLYLAGDDNQVIRAGLLGPAPYYRVILPFIKKTETIISGQRVNYMIDHQVKKVLLKAVLNTSGNQNYDVGFYSDYSLDIKVGAKSHIKLKY